MNIASANPTDALAAGSLALLAAVEWTGLMGASLRALFIVGLPGMLGGLLAGALDGEMQLPHFRNRKFVPGYFADLLFGLAGGFVVFMLLPGGIKIDQVDELRYVEWFAIAVAGGFGGRAILQRWLGEIIKRIAQVEDEQEKSAKRQAVQQAIVEQEQSLSKLDANVRKQLDEGSAGVVAQQEPDFVDRVAAAPIWRRIYYFNEAREKRREAWEAKLSRANPEALALFDRVIPVFQGLIKADRKREYHRNFAQLAYAFKERRHTGEQEIADLKLALENLNAAIESRDRQQHAGFGTYNFVRALTALELADKTGQPVDLTRIQQDLATAAADDGAKAKLDSTIRRADGLDSMRLLSKHVPAWHELFGVTQPAAATGNATPANDL